MERFDDEINYRKGLLKALLVASTTENDFLLPTIEGFILSEVVFGKRFDKRNFAKRIRSLDLLKEEGIKRDVSHRPPMLYSLKKNIGEIIEIV